MAVSFRPGTIGQVAMRALQWTRSTFSLILLSTAFVVLPGTAAAATLSPEVQKGLSWLQAQVQADGSLAGEAASIATPLQARSEAQKTIELLAGSANTALYGALQADVEPATEYLSRRLVTMDASDANEAALLTALLANQNPDGGFGGGIGYASDVLDTAWAVLALSGKLSVQDAHLGAAATFIESAVVADGGIAGQNDIERVALTSISLLALQGSGDASAPAAIAKLSSWLLQQQQTDGSWLTDSYLTAQAMNALWPLVSDTTVKNVAGAFLLARQATDGSWSTDPFLTAVVLRAIAGIQGTVASGTAGQLAGTVVDASSTQPIAAASVSLSGAATATATAAANGSFAFTGLAAGSYQLTITAAGYSPATRTVTLAAGQSLNLGNISLAANLTSATVAGTVTDAATSTPLSGVTVTVTSGSTQTAKTGASGTYFVSNVTPGNVTVSAALSGYQTATGSATLVAGQTAAFSPALYATGSTIPGTGTYKGKVISTATGQPLSGVAIVSGATTLGTTAADGTFSLTLSAGSFTSTFVLSGYVSVSQSFVMTGGATVDAGTVSLATIPTTTSLHGHVLDSGSNPISGATVQLVGGASMQSAADGSYRLDNLGTGTLSIRVSAAGYAGQTYSLQVPQPTDIVQDFHLSAIQANGVALSAVAVLPSSTGPNTMITASSTLTNAGSTDFSGALMLLVADSGGKPVGTGGLYNTHDDPVGQVTLTSGQSIDLVGKWNSGQFAPGTYALTLRVVVPGSITRGTPLGTLIVDRQGTTTITAASHFSGTVAADPPVIRAGLNQAVALTATLRNDGNIPLPAQTYTLTVVNTKTSGVAYTTSAAGAQTAVSALLPLDFGSWTPTDGGDYRLDVASADASQGTVSGKLYVGDAAKATFTVDKTVVPTGTQTVKGTVNITGQDVAQGSISDPLAPLIRTAIQSSVTYNDTQARDWTLRNGCQGCHIQSQAMIGGETNYALTSHSTYDRSVLSNSMTTNQQSLGAIDDRYYYYKSSTMLGLWAISAYHKLTDLTATLKKAADWTVTVQNAATGEWTSEYYNTWYDSNLTFTAFNLKNLVASSKHLSGLGMPSVTYYQPQPFLTSYTSANRGLFLVTAAGDFYLPDMSGKVSHVKPDGTVVDTWTGLNDAKGLIESKTSGILVATGSGLFRLDAGGSKTQINGVNIDSITYGPDGKIWATAWNAAIYQMDEAGSVVTWWSGAPLVNPLTINFDPDGSMLIPDYGNRNIYRFAPDKSYQIVTTFVQGYNDQGRPAYLMRDGDGWLLSATNGLYRFNSDWVAERRTYSRIDQLQRLPDGSIVGVVYNTPGIVQIAPQASDISASLTAYAQAIDKATTYLMGQSISTSDNMHQAQQLLGLGEAKRFYQNSDSNRANAIAATMATIATTLRANQNTDGGWGNVKGNGSDPLITAQVGYAIDYTDPSPTDPALRKAIVWLLANQQADGSWSSYMASTHLSATTWVSIWLPIILDRLGGIDTNVSITFPANVAMTNPNPAPDSSQADGQGNLTALWHLTGVTSQGRSLGFDLTLSGLVPNEQRPVASDAHLVFNNTFTNQPLTAAIQVPSVTASAYLGLALATDQTSYPANTAVLITATVSNTGATVNGGSVALDVLAPDNTVIASLGNFPVSAIAVGGSVAVNASWNTGTLLAASGYQVRAALSDAAGRLVATTMAGFAIVANSTGGSTSPTATSQLMLDKGSYNATDRATITSRAINTSANVILSNATLTVTVTDPSAATVFTKDIPVAQVLAGATLEFVNQYAFTSAAVGTYTVTQVLKDSTGAILDTEVKSYQVQSSAATGFGLAGNIAAAPKSIVVGDPVALTFNAKNQGNAALTALPLTVRIVNPATSAVLTQFPGTANLPAGGTYAANQSWTTTGKAGDVLVATLSATVATGEITLAQDNFTLIAPPIKLDLAQALTHESRILVLAACSGHGEGNETDHHDHDLGCTRDCDGLLGYIRSLLTSPGETWHMSCDHEGDGHDDSGDDDPHRKCGLGRAQSIDTLLNSLGIAHRVTTDPAVFRKEFRSGAYTTYWFSGQVTKLHDDNLAEEVREAVNRGDSLALDGVHDQRNALLEQVVGATVRGKQGGQNAKVWALSPVFDGQGLATLGRGLRLDVSGGQIVGRYNTKTGTAAIVDNAYGQGRSLLYGIDLVASLTADLRWNSEANQGFNWLEPALPGTLGSGAYLPLTLVIKNEGVTADVEVHTTLPAGASYVAAEPDPATTPTGQLVKWDFNLAAGAQKVLTLSLRAPMAAGTYPIVTEVGTVKNGVYTAYGAPQTTNLTVTAASSGLATIKSQVKALKVNVFEWLKRDVAAMDIDLAQAAIKAGHWEDAIDHFVDAINALNSISSASTSAIRLELDQALKEVEWRWAVTQ